MTVRREISGKELLRVNVAGQEKNIVVLRDIGSTSLFDAHPLVEGFNREHGTNLTVISHKVADVAQTVGETWRSLPNPYAVDASIAYEKPGTKLGKEIVFAAEEEPGAEREPRVVLATGKFQGEKDIALVVQGLSSADFKKDGNSITLDIPENRLIVVPNFPGPDGWYMPHETGVPTGEKVFRGLGNRYDLVRYLYRLNDSSYVGLPVRFMDYVDFGQYIGTTCRSSFCLGVVAEVPVLDIPKIEALLKTSI